MSLIDAGVPRHFIDEPSWPESDSIVFLLDAATRLERDLLQGWIERHRPASADPASIRVTRIPPSRRKKRARPLDARLAAFLATGDDPLLVPLRVVWLARERDGQRVVGLRDLVTFGDPRDPDPLRQHAIIRTHPDRCRIVAGAPARASALEARWSEPDEGGRADGTSLSDFVSLQAWLALERAERHLRGTRYKVPKFLAEDLVTRRPFAKGLAELTRNAGVDFQDALREVQKYLKEIAASHSPYVIDLVAGGIRWLIDKAYTGFHYDSHRLSELYALGQEYPLVFLPSHKSNFDHLALLYALYENELPPNHTAGGINMNFFPVGPLIRRSGVFFIRRTFKDNEIYKFTLRSYIDYLIEKRFPLEWYIEGGRSRTGKLRAPRYGLLAYVVDSYSRSVSDDVIVIPVSIAYDQIQDVGAYAVEQRGGAKEQESFSWAFNAIRSLRSRYGAIHMRFGEPISLREQLGPPAPDMEERSLVVEKLAFAVATRINRATPITPISMVTLALLSVGGRSLTVPETLAQLEPFLTYAKLRDLPTTEPLALDTPERVRSALEALAANGVVQRFDGATATVYGIGDDQHLAAAYYRNTIIHFFVDAAIAELALVAADRSDDDSETVFWQSCYALRDLLKFEFFFASRDRFREDVAAEVALNDPRWQEALARGDSRSVLSAFQPFTSPAVLRPFFEAYRIVADVLAQSDPSEALERDDVIRRAIDLGKQYELQRRIRTVESVSKQLFEAAIDLAANRNLLDEGSGRMDFAMELDRLVMHLDFVEAIATPRPPRASVG